jgi:hypothetical protein
VLHIALEVPLTAFHLARFLQSDHARAPRVEVLHHALDGATLAGRIASFKQYDDALTGFLGPGLQLEQLDLQQVFVGFVDAARQQVLVGVGAAAPVLGQLFVGVDRFGPGAGIGFGLPAHELANGLGVVWRRAFQNGAQGLGFLAFALFLAGKDVAHGSQLRTLAGFHGLTHHLFANACWLLGPQRVPKRGAAGAFLPGGGCQLGLGGLARRGLAVWHFRCAGRCWTAGG